MNIPIARLDPAGFGARIMPGPRRPARPAAQEAAGGDALPGPPAGPDSARLEPAENSRRRLLRGGAWGYCCSGWGRGTWDPPPPQTMRAASARNRHPDCLE